MGVLIERITESFYSLDGQRRVFVFERADGTFGFEESRWHLDDRCWLPLGRYSHAIADSAARASAEARGRVAWLAMDAAPRSPLRAPAVERLLDELCVALGFCLPPLERGGLLRGAPADAALMASAVLRADGVEPQTAPRGLYGSVLALVERAYRQARVADA